MHLAIQRDPRRETDGGPHHLYGVAYALGKYLDQGGELVGVWKDAKKYLDKYVAITKELPTKRRSLFRSRLFSLCKTAHSSSANQFHRARSRMDERCTHN